MARMIDADKLIEQIRASNLPFKGAMHRLLLQAETEDVIPCKRVFCVEVGGNAIRVKRIEWDDNRGCFMVIPAHPLRVKRFWRKKRPE